MPRSAIPDFGIEYPPWEYRPFPKYVGLDADGEALIADNEKHYEELKPLAVFPKLMGTDKNGKDVIAQIPRDLEWLKASVVKPPEDPAVVRKREEDAAFAAAETVRKAAAYDELMAQQNALTSQSASGPAVNAATGLKKSKAA